MPDQNPEIPGREPLSETLGNLENLNEGLNLDEILESVRMLLSQITESLSGIFDFDFLEELDTPTEENMDQISGIVQNYGNFENYEAPQTNYREMQNQLAAFPRLRSYAGDLEGNGNRPVAMVLSPNYNPNRPSTTIVHMHGTNSDDISATDRFQRTLESFAESGINGILVYPLSAGGRGPEGSTGLRNNYDEYWMDPENSNDNMYTLMNEVENITANQFGYDLGNSEVVIEGHSAGGMAVRNILQSGYQADRIVFLDASYGNWAGDAYNAGIGANPDMEFEIYARQGTNTDREDVREIANSRGVTLTYTDASHGGTINEHLGGTAIG